MTSSARVNHKQSHHKPVWRSYDSKMDCPLPVASQEMFKRNDWRQHITGRSLCTQSMMDAIRIVGRLPSHTRTNFYWDHIQIHSRIHNSYYDPYSLVFLNPGWIWIIHVCSLNTRFINQNVFTLHRKIFLHNMLFYCHSLQKQNPPCPTWTKWIMSQRR